MDIGASPAKGHNRLKGKHMSLMPDKGAPNEGFHFFLVYACMQVLKSIFQHLLAYSLRLDDIGKLFFCFYRPNLVNQLGFHIAINFTTYPKAGGLASHFLMCGLINFFVIALFAIYFFGPLRGIWSLKLVLAFFLVAMTHVFAHACPVPELYRVFLF